jgi:hypothetical protein
LQCPWIAQAGATIAVDNGATEYELIRLQLSELDPTTLLLIAQVASPGLSTSTVKRPSIPWKFRGTKDLARHAECNPGTLYISDGVTGDVLWVSLLMVEPGTF